MKYSPSFLSHKASLILGIASLAAVIAPAQAAITNINAATSFASLNFNDTNATNTTIPANGVTNVTTNSGPWNGTAFGLGLTVDPVTGDQANIGIAANFNPSDYAVGLTPALLSQPATTLGNSTMTVNFSVDFQTDAFGLPFGPTFAAYRVFGNILAIPGSFAQMAATINYSSAFWGLMDTRTLNFFNNVPGPFSQVVNTVPTNGFTLALPAFDVLTLSGTMQFTVDPAELQIQTVPEPSVGLLALVPFAFAFRRRR